MKKNGLYIHQQGMTLIEIMIALMLGAFLLTGVVQVFSGSKQTYRMQDNLSRMQENARFAMEFISRDIRMADYWGCVDAAEIDSNLNPDVDVFKPDYDTYATGLSGANDDNGGNDGDANNDENGNDIWDGTDSIILVGLDSSAVDIDSVAADPDTALNATGNSGLANGDIVVVSDCSAGDVFQISGVTDVGGVDLIEHSNVGGTPGNNLLPLGNATASPYAEGAQISKLVFNEYQIRDSGGVPGLSKKINDGSFQSLVGDIENMQILYGEDAAPIGDLDGTPDYYVDSSAVVNMDNVVSVRVSLLIRSTDDNLTLNPRAYTYNGVSITPTDRRLRRVYTSTIVLRNRLQ